MKQAVKRHDELFTLASDWRKSEPIAWESVIDEDRLGWKLIAKSRSQPPLEEASMIFNEILQHLRSSLDIALQELARREHLPVRLDRLQYPLAISTTDYRKQESRLKGLPAYLRRSIYHRQPFVINPGEPERHPLAMLAAFNNETKHRANLEARIGLDTFEISLRPTLDRDHDPSAKRRIEYDFNFGEEWPLITERTAPAKVLGLEGSIDMIADIAFEARVGDLVTTTSFVEGAFKEVSDSVGWMYAPWDSRLTDPSSLFLPQPGASFGITS